MKEAFAWTLSELGSVDILVNNAGMMSSGFLIDGQGQGHGQIDEGMDRLRRTIDLNVTAACTVIREAIQVMADADGEGGHILLINR